MRRKNGALSEAGPRVTVQLVVQGAQPREVPQPIWNATNDEYFRLPGARLAQGVQCVSFCVQRHAIFAPLRP